MQCVTELTPPTAVTHSVCLPFLNAKASNLVIAKRSLLQIFETKTVLGTADSTNQDGEIEASPQDVAAGTFDRTYFSSDVAFERLEQKTKLVLVGEYPLSGTVTSLKKIRLLQTKSGGEALLIAFRNAKFSIVQWDPLVSSISNISIHYYESEVGKNPWAEDVAEYGPYLTVDPSNRCAALSFGARYLAFLPMRRPADDIVEDDFELDSPLDGTSAGKAQLVSKKRETDASQSSAATPYLSSFVLKTTDFQEDITNPIHLTFLHEYREPAIGILYASQAPALADLHDRKDTVRYTVFTLDFEGREVTTILSIPALPLDLFAIHPLPPPVGGAILIGTNEIIHVDQAGKTNGVALNEMAKQGSSFPMVDQSDAELRLEGCTVEQLNDNGDLLIVLSTGELAILSFKLDGRTVSGLQAHKVVADKGGSLLSAGASCATNVGRGKIFVGSEGNDSVLLSCQRKATPLSRKRSHADMMADDADLDLDEDDFDDDDIYGGDSSPVKERRRSSAADFSTPESLLFHIHDRLPNFAPAGDITFGPTSSSDINDATASAVTPMSIVAPAGRGLDGGLIAMRQEIDPTVIRENALPGVQALWTINAKSSALAGSEEHPAGDPEALLSAEAQYDKYVVTAEATSQGIERTSVYAIVDNVLDKVEKGEFDPNGAAVEVGIMASGTRIVQVLPSEIRSYESDFSVSQICPLSSETTGAELKVVSASFSDPWLLLLDENLAVCLFKMNENGDLEETELIGDISETKWLSGCLYKSEATRNDTLAFLLSAQGTLQIYSLQDLSHAVYSSDGLSYTPSTFGPDFVIRRAAAKETLTEILVADLGDAIHSSPYLVARTVSDDLVIYQPYHTHEQTPSDLFTKDLRWLRISQPHLPKYSEEPLVEAETSGGQALLKSYSNIGGYSTITQIGTSPCLILKEASSAPRVLSLQLPALKTFSSFHTPECNQGFIYIDSDGVSRSCQLPANCRYGDTGWVVKKIPLEQPVERVVWHQAAGVYVISVTSPINFKLPEDDYHQEWANETTGFVPQRYRSTLKMVHPSTWSIIDDYDFAQTEEVTLDIKVMDLVTSEKTLQRKPCVVVGSGIVFGEDQLSEGHISVLDVIDVVPEPGRPETRHKFKLITSLKTKGAVTAVCEVGTEGFVVGVQGQKCYVRGLKDDNSLMPVAFMDMQTYVTFVKNISGTGLLLMGDALKGVCLTGYTVRHEATPYVLTHSKLTAAQEEPSYRMVPLGKGPLNMETLAGDFLPWEKNLYIVTSDSDSNLHVFQYDPENLQSVSGTRLVHKSSLHIGHFPISLIRLPSTLSPSVETDDVTNGDAMEVDSVKPSKPPEQVLYTSKSGVFALVTPIDENMYRRLSMIQVYLHNQLEHHCSLNPRGYRAVADEGLASRGVLDGTLLSRWNELSSLRKAEACAKAGVEEWVVRSDLEFIGGGGLGYL